MFLKGPRQLLLFFGNPRTGKTTLLEYLFNYVSSLSLAYHLTGFLTKEVKSNGERLGFDLIYLRDREFTLPLARRKDLVTTSRKPSVGKYVVFLENLERIIEVLKADLSKASLSPLIFIDEIGKMEVLSDKFINFMEHLREEKHIVVATLGLGEHPFLRDWSAKREAIYIEVTPENRDFLKDRLKVEFYREGKLIVLEGIDGAGKSTLFELLKGEPLFSTFIFSQEPTTGSYGLKVREALSSKAISPDKLSELFLLDRKEHVKDLILPNLMEGKKIFLDRYYLSTVAYQGVYVEEPLTLLKRNETYAPIPDLVIYLNVPVELALRRIRARNTRVSIFEKEEFLLKVSGIYEEFLPLFTHVRIEANRALDALLTSLKEILKSFTDDLQA
ncbi:MAG: dTMP kinase [Caldimicrobium sp.]|nr:dTMP kinase [Caldimicrobium sp.]MCX7873095.1 dTMP kinase [Caldimicrobium sp.]MDW8094520.1 dTMP kinase [Caldimicrobium sp.]